MNVYGVMRLIQQAGRQQATTLDLSGLDIERLPPAIGDLTHLQTLKLDGNRLTKLPPQIEKLQNLSHLSMRENLLEEFPRRILGLPNLRLLRVGYNRFASIPLELWSLTQLHTLDLSGIEQPDLSEIGRLTNLMTLSLRDCGLEELPYGIGELTELLTLNLDGNQMSELPVWLVALAELKALYLPLNDLAKFPGVLTRMRSLEHLDLSHNSIEYLPTALANMTALRTLDISTNPLQNIPAQIGTLPKLRNLYASSCTLERLPDGLCFAPALRRVWVSDNLLDQLPHDFHHLGLLESVHLSRNRFDSVPPQLLQMNGLTDLSLAYNQIETIPAEIDRVTGLQKLDLAGNQLKELPWEISNLPSLKSLNVSENHELSYFPEGMLRMRHLEDFACSSIGIRVPYNQQGSAGEMIAYLVAHREGVMTVEPGSSDADTADSVTVRLIEEDVADVIEQLKEQERIRLERQRLELPEIDDPALVVDVGPPPDIMLKMRYVLSEKTFLIPLGRRIVRTYLAHNNRFDSDEEWIGGAVLTYETDRVETSSHVARLNSDLSDGGDVTLTVTGPFPQHFFSLLVAGLDRAVHHFVKPDKRQRQLACPNPYCDHWYDFDSVLHKLAAPSHAIRQCPHCGDPLDQSVCVNADCSYWYNLDQLIEALGYPSAITERCPNCADLIDFSHLLLGFHAQTAELAKQKQLDLERRFLGGATEGWQGCQRMHHQIVALRQRQFLSYFEAAQRDAKSAFPRVLLFRPLYHEPEDEPLTADTLNDHELSVAVCCEMPGHWHRVGDYIHDPSAYAHLKLWQPYLSVLRELLPTLQYSSDSGFLLTESIGSMLDIIEIVPVPAEGEPRLALADAEQSMALFWQLRSGHLGYYLRKVRTPEGDYLWLCDQHAKQFR